jgi:hypothetical protein
VPIPFEAALDYVQEPQNVSSHQFWPFLTFEKSQRRFTRKAGQLTAVAHTKVRQLAVPSHRDGYVFALYAFTLSNLYEAALRQHDLDDSVLAYRSGLGTNYAMAEAAFQEIANRDSCLAVALDLKDFFPSISHDILKRNWCDLLGVQKLPKDHFAVFRAMTSFASVNRDECLSRLGISKGRIPPQPLCSASEFRRLVRGEDRQHTSLVTHNKKPFGIPQGAQISAVLSNISMFQFDLSMKREVEIRGGSYRRYSDDILIIADVNSSEADIVSLVQTYLSATGGNLNLNASKTESALFSRNSNGQLRASKMGGIQYLGFTFDGMRRLVRPQTMSKYARKLSDAARRVRREAAQSGKPISKREIYRRYSHLGKSNFITRYLAAAEIAMPNSVLRKQVRRHMRRIKTLTETT